MMQKMLIDEDDPQELANFIFPGLVRPCPISPMQVRQARPQGH